MKRVAVLPSFSRSVKALSPRQRQALQRCMELFNIFLTRGELPVGLGFKKINGDKYEIRADIRLRIVFKLTGDCYFLVLAGSHDQVRRWLKQYR